MRSPFADIPPEQLFPVALSERAREAPAKRGLHTIEYVGLRRALGELAASVGADIPPTFSVEICDPVELYPLHTDARKNVRMHHLDHPDTARIPLPLDVAREDTMALSLAETLRFHPHLNPRAQREQRGHEAMYRWGVGGVALGLLGIGAAVGVRSFVGPTSGEAVAYGAGAIFALGLLEAYVATNRWPRANLPPITLDNTPILLKGYQYDLSGGQAQ